MTLGALADPAVSAAGRPPTAGEIARAYNPFGDPWATNRGPNPFVPIGLTPACHLRGPHTQLPGLLSEEVAFLARSSSSIVFDACGDLADDDPKLRAAATALKATAPHLRYVGYVVADLALTSALTRDGPYPVGLREIDRHEEWFVHKRGRPPTRANRVRGHNSWPQDVLDLTNPRFQDFFAGAIARSLDAHSLGGVLVDGCGTEPLARHVDEVAPALRANWARACLTFLAKVRRAVGRDKLVFITGVHEDHDTLRSGRSFAEQRLRLVHGLLWEDPMSALSADLRSRSDGFLERITIVLDMARRLGDKYVAIFVNTNINGPGNLGRFEHTNRAQEQGYARYYLALYLNLMRGERTPLIYYTPTPVVPWGEHFHSEAFFRDWNLRIGSPTGPSEEIVRSARDRGAVLRRPYQDNQWAYVNNTLSPYTVRLRTSRDRVTRRPVPLYTADGTPLACDARRLTCTHAMAPKSGELFITRRTLETR